MLMSINNAPYTLYGGYITELGEINGIQMVFILNNYFAYYAFTKDNIFKLSNTQNPFHNKPFAFTFDDYYSSYEFQGIMPDSGATKISLVGKPQV